ncbi:2931_t:CDS:2 [Acaulospora morrowiae]|uniref:2931_t:CDS:1 n=1 Tax=Acaulospora morrowiae TaxID=94023 RepID=A0A9N8WLZ6_9GLOM|nr:2931_t:CDS:2 [Acaulospora morrowiae]
MDYSIHLPNANYSVSSHFGNFTVHQTNNNNTGRKRARSDSMNKSDQAQKTSRLLSPPRQRFPPTLSCCSEVRLNRSNSISELSCKTQLLAVQDPRLADPMDCDITSFELEGDMIQPPGSTATPPLSHSSSPTRAQRVYHRQTHVPSLVYTMGRRADCERCRLRVPGHFAHVINQ